MKRFEKRGHVRRVSNPKDGRSYLLELTAAGRRAHRKAGELFLPILKDVTGKVGSRAAETDRHLRELHAVIESTKSSG